MSLQHLTMNELDCEVKSLKINGVPVIPQFGIFPFKGSFGVQGTRYLESYSGNGKTSNDFNNGIQMFRPTKISTGYFRRSGINPATTFNIFKTDIYFQTITNIESVVLQAGSPLHVKALDYTLQAGEILFVSTSSTGTGNPGDVAVTIECQNA